MIEGLDYSRGGPLTSAQLKAIGKKFVGRYAVNDKTPEGRGITAAEYAELTAGGIDVFLYWQSTTNWMLNGYAAGISAAVNAQQNITAAGMPHDTPVYFACDFDASEDQQDLIDHCLRGAAKVLGPERVGLYAGYWPLLRAKQNGTARWFCQTLAWSGGRLLEGVHLYQYDTSGNFPFGVDVDWVRAYQENYGQAVPPVVIPSVPAPPKPAPITWEVGDSGVIDYHGTPVYALVAEVTCIRATHPRNGASRKRGANLNGDREIQPNEKCEIVGTLDSPWYFWNKGDGTFPRLSKGAFIPKLPRPRDAA